jgi:hypothetical protein
MKFEGNTTTLPLAGASNLPPQKKDHSPPSKSSLSEKEKASSRGTRLNESVCTA